MRNFLVAAIAAMFLTLSTAAQQAAPPTDQLLPVPGKISTITSEPGFHNEPTIAVNPANPQQAFAAYQTHARVSYSQDGGATWNSAPDTASTAYKVSGDVPRCTTSMARQFFATSRSISLGRRITGHAAPRATASSFGRSPDGGATWDKDEHAIIAQPTKPGIPFEDKPGIAADDTDGKYAGNLYVGWTEFRIDESVILFSRSKDGGLTWSAPLEISTHHGLPRDDNGAVEGFSAAVGADGTVLRRLGRWRFACLHPVSRWRRELREEPRRLADGAHCTSTMQGLERANGFPQIGIDPRHGKHGRLFVTWSDYRTGDIGVYSATSEDEGKTWSRPFA